MAGQIVKHGPKTWLVRVFLGRDPETGKRNYHNKTIKGTRRTAQEYLNAALREKDLGHFSVAEKMGVNQFLDRWLENAVKPRVEEKTFESYGSVLRLYVRPALGKLRLDQLTPLVIQELYTRMHSKNGLSPRTVRYTHTVFKNALQQACRWRLLSANPADQVELPRRRRSAIKCLTPEEANRFLEAADDDRWGIVFHVAVTTGMRPGEYLGLQWSDIDWEGRSITVQHSLMRPKGGGFRLKSTKTRGSRRRITVPTPLLERLREHQAAAPARPPECEFDFVFTTGEGQPLCARNLRRRHLGPILTRAGLPQLRLYDLRHLTATLLLSAGEHPKVVASQLGHQSVMITLDTYSHLLPTMLEGAAAKLEQMLYRDEKE